MFRDQSYVQGVSWAVLNVPLNDATAEADSAAGPSSTPTVSAVTASVTLRPASSAKSMEVNPARCGQCSAPSRHKSFDTAPQGTAACNGSVLDERRPLHSKHWTELDWLPEWPGMRAYKCWVVDGQRRRPKRHCILVLRDHQAFEVACAVDRRCRAAMVTCHESGIVRT